jgi:hypothetical protein
MGIYAGTVRGEDEDDAPAFVVTRIVVTPSTVNSTCQYTSIMKQGRDVGYIF